ncbi:hypothetical protein KGY79_01015 [Candidatus Bipolaricaulota bacterium]|nr:hypothetical protein [Candidatus Bipolaricaulota bacterium]
MSKKTVLYIGVVLVVGLVFLANSATGSEIEDKLTRIVRMELGLAPEVYNVIETEYQGEKVILIVIFGGNEKAQRSKLGPDIKSGLKKYEGMSPVAISVLTRDKDVEFQPYALRIMQNGRTSQANQIIGITDGFKEGRMPEKVPIQGKVFWGSKGIITLGSSFDSTTPFRIKYGTKSANFALGPSGTAQQGETELGETPQENEQTKLENEKTGMEDYEDSNVSEQRDESSPPVSSSSSKSGQGLSLLVQLATLLAITFSFL